MTLDHDPQEPAVAARPPRAVRRGPPITLTCECGQRRELRYGERWTCEACGRTWDTSRIPAHEYAAFRRTQVRQRVAPLAVSLLVAGAVIALFALGRPLAVVVVVPFAAFVWSKFVRPLRRRRYRQALADLPSWQIKPE